MKKLTAVLLICIIITFMGGCSMFSGEFTKREKLNEDLSSSSELQINNRVGSIQIKQSKSNILSVEIIKKVNSKDKNSNNEIMENIRIKLTKEGNKVILSAVTANDENIDLWDWKDSSLTNVNIAVDYVLNVPKTIKLFNIKNGIGKMNINDVSGIFNLDNDLGQISLSNLNVEGDSSIVTGNGDLNISFDNISDSEKISLSTDLGSIDLRLPKDFNYDLDKKDSQMTSKLLNLVNDKTSINIEAGLGSVKINGQKVK